MTSSSQDTSIKYYVSVSFTMNTGGVDYHCHADIDGATTLEEAILKVRRTWPIARVHSAAYQRDYHKEVIPF